MNRGLLYAFAAYLMWGVLPIFWKTLQAVPALEILGHRIFWSFVALVIVLAYRRQWHWVKPTFSQRRTVVTFGLISTVITLNWGVYIWGVNAGYIVETSLGYFINPLVSVVLGVIFLRERLRLWQWVAVGMALLGVLYLTFGYGSLPWIALTLAFSFGFYGLLKKTADLNALEGLTLETALIAGPALGYLLYLEVDGVGAFAHTDLTSSLLLVLTGVATALPLLLFAAAARRIPLSALGFMQYIAPTIQFLLGVFVYSEPFDHSRLIGFSLIWSALLIYSAERFIENRKHTAISPA